MPRDSSSPYLVVPSAGLGYRDWSYVRAYERTAVGDSRHALAEEIGQATDVTLGHDDPEGTYFSAAHDCALNLWYNAFFTIERYQFRYSSEDRLLHKYLWSSW